MDYQILQREIGLNRHKGDSLKPARTAAQPHPAARALSLVGAAVLALILISSPASAQIPSVGDTVGQVVGGVTGGNGGSTGGSSGGGGSVGDTVGQVGGTVGDTAGQVGGTVGDTVTDTGGKVGDAVGGPVGDAVKDTTGAVGGAVKDATGSAGGAVKDATGAAGHAIDNATEPVLGERDRGGQGEKDHGGRKDGQKDGQKSRNDAGSKDGKGGKSTVLGGSAFGEGAFGFGTRVPAITLGSAGSQELAGDQVAAFAPEPLDLGALTEAAVEAAKKFAFPILLSILVAAFMLIQDRVDRKDPKLALAAVDTDQEWLSFA